MERRKIKELELELEEEEESSFVPRLDAANHRIMNRLSWVKWGRMEGSGTK